MFYTPIMILALALLAAIVVIGFLCSALSKTKKDKRFADIAWVETNTRLGQYKHQLTDMAQTATDRLEMIEKLKAQHEEQLAGVNGQVQVFHTQMEDRLTAQQAQANEAVSVRNSLLQSCIPALLQIATLNADTEKGDRAARLLYVLNVLGAWTPDKSTARVIARGQVISQANPAEIDKVIAKIREEAPAPAAATLKITTASS